MNIGRARKVRSHRVLSALSAISAVIVVVALTRVVHAADELQAARDLYASAAYEEALAALNRARAAGVPPADAFALEEYRAFCLLALGRGTEAQSAIENLVMADPLFRPSVDVSPRVRTAFSDVRKRLLPSVIPQQYAKAKAAFDKKDWATAATGFTQVLNVLADPDMIQAAGQPPLSDIKTLATGFQELAAKSVPPPPPPPPALSVAAVLPQAPALPTPPPARVYTAGDPKVVPPAVLRQDLPAFSGRPTATVTGALEVIINERGQVEVATIRESVNPTYDRLAVDATRSWRYRPATLDGVPVKFRKLISITLKPTP